MGSTQHLWLRSESRRNCSDSIGYILTILYYRYLWVFYLYCFFTSFYKGTSEKQLKNNKNQKIMPMADNKRKGGRIPNLMYWLELKKKSTNYPHAKAGSSHTITSAVCVHCGHHWVQSNYNEMFFVSLLFCKCITKETNIKRDTTNNSQWFCFTVLALWNNSQQMRHSLNLTYCILQSSQSFAWTVDQGSKPPIPHWMGGRLPLSLL